MRGREEGAGSMSDGVNRFLGDTPLRVVVKLLILSVALGFVMSVLGLYPDDILRAVRDFIINLWETGFARHSAASETISCSAR